jgi:hypothetical protein
MSKSRRSSSLPKKPKKPEITDSWFDCTNAKAAVGQGLGYLNAIHYMDPHNMSGGATVCPWAARCAKPCLTWSGQGHLPNVRLGRRRRALLFKGEMAGELSGPVAYAAMHRVAIDGHGSRVSRHLIAVARNFGLIPALRLNGTSDIPWEKPAFNVFQPYPKLVKYDYTKGWERVLDWLRGRPGSLGHGFRSFGRGDFSDVENYHLTMSFGGVLDSKPHASETYQEILALGGNIAAVWETEEKMAKAIAEGVNELRINDAAGNTVKAIDLGRRVQVIDGNAGADAGGNGDLRFLDPKGVIVGLYAKKGTLNLDSGRLKMFIRNPSSRRGSGGVADISGLPMGAIRVGGPKISIDAE